VFWSFGGDVTEGLNKPLSIIHCPLRVHNTQLPIFLIFYRTTGKLYINVTFTFVTLRIFFY
jgi:hypothetical protein